jgi:hypothetical protein
MGKVAATMSINPLNNPFKPYVERCPMPLQGEIAEWLAGFKKTLDDVVWWEMNGNQMSPYPDAPLPFRRITVVFAGSDEKHEKLFLMGMSKAMME